MTGVLHHVYNHAWDLPCWSDNKLLDLNQTSNRVSILTVLIYIYMCVCVGKMILIIVINNSSALNFKFYFTYMCVLSKICKGKYVTGINETAIIASQLIFNVNNFKKLAFSFFSILISWHYSSIFIFDHYNNPLKLRSENNRYNFISIKLIESQFP